MIHGIAFEFEIEDMTSDQASALLDIINSYCASHGLKIGGGWILVEEVEDEQKSESASPR